MTDPSPTKVALTRAGRRVVYHMIQAAIGIMTVADNDSA